MAVLTGIAFFQGRTTIEMSSNHQCIPRVSRSRRIGLTIMYGCHREYGHISAAGVVPSGNITDLG